MNKKEEFDFYKQAVFVPSDESMFRSSKKCLVDIVVLRHDTNRYLISKVGENETEWVCGHELMSMTKLRNEVNELQDFMWKMKTEF